MSIRHPSGGQAWLRRFGASRGRRSAAAISVEAVAGRPIKSAVELARHVQKGGPWKTLNFEVAGQLPADSLG